VRKILRQDRQTYGHKTSKVSIDDFHFQREGEKGMNPRICICCGQPMAVGGNALSRNPNICASCSSILDGMNDLEPNEFERPVENLPEKPEPALAERL
jgi:hypothetical protein